MSIKSKLGAGAIGLCTLYASSVFAAALTGPPVIDTTTQGSWMGTYGECYNVLPQASPRTCIPEVQIGPDFKGDQPLQYINVMDPNCIRDGAAQPEFSEAVCVTGDATGNFDVRVFTDGENNAYAWGFDEPGSGGSAEVLPGRSQDNACKDVLPAGLHSPDDVYASTFDSDAYSRDPLSAEIKLTLGGDATIAYYFLSEADVCRAQDFVLSVNGTPVAGAAGTVDDISNGTYVVFDLIDIPDGALIRLDVTQGDPSCEPNAFNSHLSGIFVDGTNACLDPFCGDGNVDVDLGETCEMPGDPTNDGGVCRDDCTYCGDGIVDDVEECDPAAPGQSPATCDNNCEIIVQGGEGCTPGFYKNLDKHLKAWGGINPDDLFSDWFDDAFPGKDLEYVLRKGGGGLKALGRHTVAALLNANNGDVAYGMTVMQVQDAFNDLYPATGENKKAQYNALKNTFRDANESGCPINGKSWADSYEYE